MVHAEWISRSGDRACIAAEDFDQAVRLIEEQANVSWKRGEHSKLKYWLDKLPLELLLSNPNLCVFQAWKNFANGKLDLTEATLKTVEKFNLTDYFQNGSDRMRVQGRAATIRAFLAFHNGDFDAIFEYTQLALENLPEDDIFWRNIVNVPLGDAFSLTGNVEDTVQIRLETWETSKTIGNIYMELIASMKYCVTLRQQGKFDEIMEICQQQKILATENGLSMLPETGWVLAQWGEALAEQGELDKAVKNDQGGKGIAQRGYTGMLYWCNLCLIAALFSSEHFAEMEAIIQEFEEYGWDRLPPWILVEINAWKLRLWLVQSKFEEMSQWFEEQGLEVTGNSERYNEREYLILVRFLIATGHPSGTLELLERVYANAYDRGHISRMIEILNVRALAIAGSRRHPTGDNCP